MTDRRQFLKTTGSLTIGFSLLGTACVRQGGNGPETDTPFSTQVGFPGQLPDGAQVNAWLQVLEDGHVRVLTGKHELGQGLRGGMQLVAAEELVIHPDRVLVQVAETGITQDEGYTAGSRSMESSAMSVRRAAASAREHLLEAAAKNWNVDASELTMADGVISHGSEETSWYDLLNGQQLTANLRDPQEIYAKTRRKWVGQAHPRPGIAQMVRGQYDYIQDLRFPDMVHARVVRPSGYASSLEALDEGPMQEMDGLVKIVRRGDFLAVVAEDEWQAIQLQRAGAEHSTWTTGEALPADQDLREHLRSLPASTETDVSEGSVDQKLGSGNIRYSASYSKPYIMHGANGPSCALARWENNQLEVWTHSQGVYPLRRSLSALLEIDEAAIHVKAVPGSGCYGHNGADDVAAEAALIAREVPGRHVRLQWMREDEHGWEPYGTAMLMDLEASLDKTGKITAWSYDLWSDGHSTRPGGQPNRLLPAWYIGKGYERPGAGFRGGAVRNAPPYYALSDVRVTSHIVSGPLRKSALRGLGAYANLFAIEAFMDELAEQANQDPVEFRLRHLDDPRALACLRRLREETNDVTTGDGEGLGYAFSRYKNSAAYCSVAAKVVVREGEVQVTDLWATVDAGEVISLDGLKNQIEGGMVQSASWALHEQVQFDRVHVTSLDWNTYPVLRFPGAPRTTVIVLDQPDQPPLGAGEASQGPATAAIVNAVYRATGERVRDLPV